MTRLRPELLDELLVDYETPEDLLGEEGLFKQLKKALLERALGAELSDHLGYEKGDPAGRGTGNSRNGHSGKTVLTGDGAVELAVPRDRNGTFEPAIVPKGERRLDGFDDRILSLYARGMTVREIRNSLAFVSWKDRKKVMPDLKAIYRAETAEAAAAKLDEFEASWGARYPAVAPAWRRAWEHVVPMFAFPPTIRKMIYTTNALESLHRSLRKIIKTRGSFPSDEAATKLLFLAIRNAGMRWKRPVAWTAAMGQFAILFEDRFPASAR